MTKPKFPDAYEVPQKRQIRWTLIILSLFFLGLLVDYLFLHLLFKEKVSELGAPTSQVELTVSTKPVTQVPPPPPQKVEPVESPTPVSVAAIQKFQAEVAKCFGAAGTLAKSKSSEELVQQILASNPAKTSRMDVENTHIRLGDGSVRRMHLIASDNAGGKNSRELRYFSLDEEGLPVPIELPEKDRINPTEAYLDSLKKEGTVIFHQVKERRQLNDGTSLSLNTINDRIYEFQLFGKEKTFSCRDIRCQCR